jgi:divalent metal cation (Fe/Co/Zn/Cd) transporter
VLARALEKEKRNPLQRVYVPVIRWTTNWRKTTVLIGVAVFLAVEVKSLLLGEAADPALLEQVDQVAAADARIEKVLRAIAVQQGPSEIMLALKLKYRDDLTGPELVNAINEFEVRLQAQVPEVKWSFVEPDTTD